MIQIKICNIYILLYNLNIYIYIKYKILKRNVTQKFVLTIKKIKRKKRKGAYYFL